MTAPTALPEAVDRAGVAPGWWVTGVRHGSSVAHRLQLDPNDARTTTTTAVCGRRVMRPVDASERDDSRSCGDCVKKSQRALPQAPIEPSSRPAPSGRQVRAPSGTTGEVPNTVAARVARRRTFRDHVLVADGAHDYVPQPYGVAGAQAAMAAAIAAEKATRKP